jgi:plasmid stabilization system protein ParE
MRLEWTLKALGDLREAGNYIAEDNPQAAEKLAGRVREAVEYLLEHPNMGRPGRLPHTRELVISGTPFIIIY